MVGDDLLFFERLADETSRTAFGIDQVPAKTLVDDNTGYAVSTHDMQMMMVGATFVSAFVGAYLGGEADKPVDTDLSEWCMAGCMMIHEMLERDGYLVKP